MLFEKAAVAPRGNTVLTRYYHGNTVIPTGKVVVMGGPPDKGGIYYMIFTNSAGLSPTDFSLGLAILIFCGHFS